MLAMANLNKKKKTMQEIKVRHYTANTLEKVAACHDFICTNPVCGEGIKALAGRFSISSLWQDVFPSHQACFAPVSRMNTESRLDDS